ncbi:hypothetical protein R3751_15815 [Halorubrum distributum]|uniref:hypothetical protein n=1 Tax=Halorubrum distributum TaxID=29283 RepID=UPI002953F0DA|nr:hypothetical protein [Halorubrum distributum]MDV7351233.1 hypothetical protein [Halorubrum distributum]
MSDRKAENDYALGSITGAVKYQQYLRKEQSNEQVAKRTAHRWALRQLAVSGADREEVLEDLKLAREITNRLIETIEMSGMPQENLSEFNDGYNNP